jgi:hypothetical protein
VPPWVRTRVVDPESLEPAAAGPAGLLQHFDLANVGSVMAIQTEDLGVAVDDGFRLLGRAPGATPRGCSIAMDLLLEAVDEAAPLTMRIPAFHLPGLPRPHAATDTASAAAEIVVAGHDDVQAFAPRCSTDDIDAVCRALLDARQRLLDMPVARVIRAVDHVARRLRDPAEPERRRVLLGLTAITGYSSAMAELVLDRMTDDWLDPALARLVRAELGGPEAVEGFIRRLGGSRTRAVAPALGLHVFAGTVPGVSVTSIVRALLVRSAVLGKCGAGEPVLAPAFARLLAETDPDVGACVAVTYWQGGDEEIEATVLQYARLIVHYGGAEAIASLRGRAGPGVRFVEHGPRISFALVGPHAFSLDGGRPVAHDLADAVACFDQQGCVSPQIAYVIGDADRARRFASMTADALARLNRDLPRGRIEPAEATAVRELRTRAEFGSPRDFELWDGDGMSHTVVFAADPVFEGTCLNRTLLVKCVPDIDDVVRHAAPFGRVLQTVGVAGFSRSALAAIASSLAAIGVTRIAPVAAMPWPPVTWHHDGRGPLNELVRWVDLEVR